MRKALVWVRGEVKTPPFSEAARLETGVLLERLKLGEKLSLPHSRPMPSIGRSCHELRITDENKSWRIVYGIRVDAIVVFGVFPKTTRRTPKKEMDACKARLRRYDGKR